MNKRQGTIALSSPRVRRDFNWTYVFCFGLLPAALLWSYWPTLRVLIRDWTTDHDYSSGGLVPFAALYLAWHDRKLFRSCKLTPEWTWGACVLAVAILMRAFGLLFHFKSAERYSFIVTIAAMVLLVAGREVFLQCKWILLFLFLLVPLPGRVHNMIAGPLQEIATVGAVITLELLGIPVLRQGNLIVLDHQVTLAVAEACSGLRMLTAFVMVTATLAYIVKRPRWQKCVLLLSSIPVALICNWARLVGTALLCLVTGEEWAERFFHDFAGVIMMPLAVIILLAELWVISKLIIEEHAEPAS